MTVIVVLIVSFPYFRKYTSDSMQEKFDKISNTATIVKKVIGYSYGKKSTEHKKNDNTENKETGK